MSEKTSKIREELDALTKIISEIYNSEKLEVPYLSLFKKRANSEKLGENAPDTVKIVEKHTVLLGIRQVSRFYHVESDYYDWELQRRAFRLVAPSTAHLCKSVIFENTRCEHNEISDPLNSKYYCVIVQYISAINTQKLINYVRDLKQREISKKFYNLRVTSPEKSLYLTGFDNNGVCPLGMKNPVPIILSESITSLKPPIFFLGAGDVDWKISLPVEDFVRATRCFIADF